MEDAQTSYGGLPAHNSRSQPDLEPRPLENGLHVLPLSQAGLEVEPTRLRDVLTSSEDDNRTTRTEHSQGSHRSKRLFGLRARTFWICLITFGLLVIAIASGASVGASRRSANSAAPTTISTTNLPTATSPPISSVNVTATTTTSAPIASATSGGCKNGTFYFTTNRTPFQEYCDTDFSVGPPDSTAADWNSLGNVATFEGCMDLCAFDRSQGIKKDVDGQCLSITWNPNRQVCYLKNNTVLIGSFNSTNGTAFVVPRVAIGLFSASITG